MSTYGEDEKLDNTKQNEFAEAAKPLIKFIADNFHPHVTVIVDCSSAEMLEGICSFRTEEFIKD